MLTNLTSITIFSAKKLGRETVWFGYQLSGVNYHGSSKTVVGDKEVTAAEEYTVRIPAEQLADYLDSNTWKAMSVDELFGHFTLQKGDYVVKGLVDTEVSSSAEILKIPDVKVISEITENLHASSYSRHIKLVLK
jgi:hypothetical protein